MSQPVDRVVSVDELSEKGKIFARRGCGTDLIVIEEDPFVARTPEEQELWDFLKKIRPNPNSDVPNNNISVKRIMSQPVVQITTTDGRGLVGEWRPTGDQMVEMLQEQLARYHYEHGPEFNAHTARLQMELFQAQWNLERERARILARDEFLLFPSEGTGEFAPLGYHSRRTYTGLEVFGSAIVEEEEIMKI